MPKEAFPPSPECWRVHPSMPNATPYLHHKKPDLFLHLHTLTEQRKERESQRMMLKTRKLPRCTLPISIIIHTFQDGLGQEWGKARARENLAVLEKQLHQVGVIALVLFPWFHL